jgi:arylesterase / paraoxonase
MTRRGRRLGLTAGAVLLVGLAFAFANTVGWLRSVDQVPFGTCKRLTDRSGGPVGAEDIALDPQTGLAYISSLQRSESAGGNRQGGIYIIDTMATAPLPERLPSLDPKGFAPQGVDLFIAADGRKRLFVINHGASGKDHSIEIFDILGDGGLAHAETIRSDLFTSPNDIAAIGPRSFYVSDDQVDSSPLRRIAETYLMMPLGTVVYFNAISATKAADGLRFPKGLLADPTNARLYVAQSAGRSVTRFAIAPDGQLQEDAHISLPMAADNLSASESGTVIVTGHPRPLAFLRASNAPNERQSPTLIMEISPDLDDKTVIYSDDGGTFSGGSIALKSQTRLFAGAVFGAGVLFCSTVPLF